MSAPENLATVEPVPHGRTARRLEWAHLPPYLRGFIEGRLGSRVTKAESQGSGFTPGFASKLTAEDGTRLFVKAASKKAQKNFAESYAEEVRKLRLLPEGLPITRLLWSHEDDLWVVLGFECVEGNNPRRPWQRTQLDACLRTLELLADALNPVPARLHLSPITEDLPDLLTGWDYVRRTHPDWPHLDEAAALAASYQDFEGNDGFVHSDARDDNFLVDRAGHAVLCDWNWPTLGPVWMDTVDLLVSAFGDGMDADEILASLRLTKDVDPNHIDSVIAQLCGFMLEGRDRPVPATSPYLRVHCRWYSEATWAWLAHRRGWS
jgi:aminoglycoside phosphotransferase (APT) family kinase protein